MPLTTNWDIYYRDTSTPASLETESATQATSIEDALNAIVAAREIQTYKWANSTERSSQIGMTGGDIGFQTDTGITYRYSGTAWKGWESDWISYTPTLANITLGSGGTSTESYKYSAGVVKVRLKIVLGTGGSVGTGPTMTLPMTHEPLSVSDQNLFGDVGYLDASGSALYPGKMLMNGSSTTVAKFYHTNTGAFTGLSATSPFPWTVSDVLYGTFEFVPA